MTNGNPSFQFKAATSRNLFNDSIRQNKDFADVLLLIGPSKTPIWAHAAILSQGCDYYKAALSMHWTTSPPQDLDVGTKIVRAVLNHPDVDVETMNIVLEFIYSGTARVSADKLSTVALFADELVLGELVAQCVKYCRRALVQSPKTAFEFYALGQKLNNHELKYDSVYAVSWNLEVSAVEGKAFLAQLDVNEIREVLSNTELDEINKWRLSVIWTKAQQNLGDISFKSGLSTGFDVQRAAQDIKPLILSNKLFLFEKESYLSEVAPYACLLEESTLTLLKAHLDIHDDQTPVDTTVQLFDSRILMSPEEQRQFLTQIKAVSNRLRPTKMKLIYRASEHNFSNSKFHEICDGAQHTVTVVKTVGGRIIGGYMSSFTTVLSTYKPVLFAFERSTLLMTLLPFETPMLAKIPGNNNGPIFGSLDLALESNRVSCSTKGRVFSLNAKTYDWFLGTTNGAHETTCEEYEVFQLSK
ncbi:hypothetical protein BCR33DRAFT_115553 [Rhizoclosmatium globosum]|uniref:BTB domain-containing protein n=1 Tax=Rhizoclosmatium globosum TaxID=329046 RepID=A0A1Y2CJ18_9FUNG|nr:hypothetical protein BCR33DRAFT_115553 [Rhizoclosmatium globosum]|eukprot:ORY47038.1 hypothetical protein BCR33DRAFT_115553 [Rhizoclosmatium globosum]